MADFSQFFSPSSWLMGGPGQAPRPAQPDQQAVSPAMMGALRRWLGLGDAANSDQTGEAAEVAAQRVRAPYAKANERVSGLPQLGEYFGNKIASAVTAPRDAFTGAMPVNDPATGMPTPEAMQRGQGVANLAMTGGIPMAERGAMGMAGGKLTAPEPPVSGVIKGVYFDRVTPAQHEELRTASRNGASAEEVQKMVDGYKGKSSTPSSTAKWEAEKEVQYDKWRRGGTFRPFDRAEFEARLGEELKGKL